MLVLVLMLVRSCIIDDGREEDGPEETDEVDINQVIPMMMRMEMMRIHIHVMTVIVVS